VAVATVAFICRPRMTNVKFYTEPEPEPEVEVEPEVEPEPMTSREQYLQNALEMAYQHRAVLEEEVKMLQGWVDHFQQNPSPYPVEDENIDLEKAILLVLDQHRQDGVTAEEIFNELNDYFEGLTKTEINQRLYAMNKKEKVRFFTDNASAPTWRL